MKTIALTFTIITTALFASQINARNYDPMNLSPLSGDYVISNLGFETVIPVWTRTDTDGDGTPESEKFRIDVYKVGTATKLFSTPEQSFVFSTMSPCKASTDFSFEKETDFKRIGNILVVSVKGSWSCGISFVSYYEGDIGYVYAVDLSSPANKPWTKTYTQKLDGVGILPDANSNGVGELFVMISKETQVQKGKLRSEDVTVTTYIYDGLTGASLATPKGYALQR